MPKIDVHEQGFFDRLGTRLTTENLEELLTVAKAELDAEADENGIAKFELNDTNRPDLWSATGLARQLRIHRRGEIPEYDFFSTARETRDPQERRVLVDPAMRSIRPYVTAFAVVGPGIDDAGLLDLIQTQEKLTWNYGQKRKAIAMGVYRSSLMKYPVHYTAADPQGTRFEPLGMEREMTLREILTEHPKGRDFAFAVEGLDRMPFLSDDRGEVLSFPPIINSAYIGDVQEGDRRLFIEMTGGDLKQLLHACSIVACDLADEGYRILPVRIVYPYDTPFGREIVTPYYFQQPQTIDVADTAKLLGVSLTSEQAVESLGRMGVSAQAENGAVTAYPPPYRNDFLHPVDVVEDVMIGLGMDSFEPARPSEFTVGRLSEAETFSRQVKDIMVGLGYQEMIFNYLGSYREFVERMYPEEAREEVLAEFVKVSNPLSENYEYVRHSIIPHLLSAESVSANATYPHLIFETGKVVRRDARENYGSRTINALGFLTADAEADFNRINSHVSALMYYLGYDHSLRETSDPRFTPGRAAEIVVNGVAVGVFGEIHPRALESWGIQMPCAAGEVDMDDLG
ncbi:MAG: phenylalanine--tRNA ligase subunit beta [Spirochaetaceae bacterium]